MASDYGTIVNSLIQGPDVRWTNYFDYNTRTQYSRPIGSPTVVTYSFDQSIPGYTAGQSFPDFRPLNDAERANVRTAINIWDQASGVVLMEVPAGAGDIQIGAYNFSNTSHSGNTGYAFYPGFEIGGDVWFNTSNSTPNAVSVPLAVHEIGHALGLKHPFDPGQTGVRLPSSEDNKTNTVMSYTGNDVAALGSYDVLAIQYLYGPNVSPSALYPAGYSPEKYLAANRDLLNYFGTDLNAANYHYLTAGMREGRNADFDGLRYAAGHADLAQAFGADETAATLHYVYAGVKEGRDPKAFSPYSYIASYGDLQTAFGSNARAAELHYLSAGRLEGRQISFDPYAYMASNMDVLFAVNGDPDKAALHYLENGRTEGRVTTSFDAATYLRLNGDLRAAFGSDTKRATQHYVQYGWKEGRPIYGVGPSAAASPAPAADALQGVTSLQAAAWPESQASSGLSLPRLTDGAAVALAFPTYGQTSTNTYDMSGMSTLNFFGKATESYQLGLAVS